MLDFDAVGYQITHLPAQAARCNIQGSFTLRDITAVQCRVLDFDVVGHPRANFCFAVTFPFHPYTDGRKGGEVR
jgi:hypothetical protein